MLAFALFPTGETKLSSASLGPVRAQHVATSSRLYWKAYCQSYRGEGGQKARRAKTKRDSGSHPKLQDWWGVWGREDSATPGNRNKAAHEQLWCTGKVKTPPPRGKLCAVLLRIWEKKARHLGEGVAQEGARGKDGMSSVRACLW